MNIKELRKKVYRQEKLENQELPICKRTRKQQKKSKKQQELKKDKAKRIEKVTKKEKKVYQY